MYKFRKKFSSNRNEFKKLNKYLEKDFLGYSYIITARMVEAFDLHNILLIFYKFISPNLIIERFL
jgi:hypothetical protein